MSLVITNNNFETEVLNASVPVLVDFWAQWCGPCRMLAPVIEEVEQEVGESAKICKIDVDSEMELATRFGIMTIPALLIFKGGEVAETMVGFHAKEEILEALKKY